MPYPEIYGGGAPAPLVNYDFLEFTTGRGIIGFNLMDTALLNNSANASYSYVLTTTSSIGKRGFLQVAGAVASSFSFVTQVSRPFIIEGQALASIMQAASNSGGSSVRQWIWTMDLSKISSNGALSFIASGAILCDTDTLANGASEFIPIIAHLDIPNTNLKIGDTLQFTLSTPGTGSSTSTIGTDPANRASLAAQLTLSNSIIYLPVRTK